MNIHDHHTSGAFVHGDFAPREDADFEPTSARPGSAEKLAVLVERVRRGLPLWHKLDMTIFCEPGQRTGIRMFEVHAANQRRWATFSEK